MTSLTLSEELLTVLLAIQQKKALAITESNIDGFNSSWLDALERYFYSLPKDLMQRLGLKRNTTCFRATVRFQIPPEWLETDISDLALHTFTY